ncbi:hypothetical protein FXO38_00957 [Capsicum annuum]|nr:hypothetical protein FXO37_23230 [Capsicum annuum]KAF3683052.1 hypothetical protein FXO38_00957 [Capsicum annuum]
MLMNSFLNMTGMQESDRINCGVYILTPDIFNAIQGVSTQWKDRVEVFLSQLCAASPFCDSETVPSGLQAEWGHLCTDTDNTDIGSIFAFFVRKGCCGKLNWILLSDDCSQVVVFGFDIWFSSYAVSREIRSFVVRIVEKFDEYQNLPQCRIMATLGSFEEDNKDFSMNGKGYSLPQFTAKRIVPRRIACSCKTGCDLLAEMGFSDIAECYFAYVHSLICGGASPLLVHNSQYDGESYCSFAFSDIVEDRFACLCTVFRMWNSILFAYVQSSKCGSLALLKSDGIL